jgi:hypothetical protein
MTLAKLIDDGYEAEVREQHLLVHSVPYVAPSREVKRGTIACTYIESGGVLERPDNHQVWFSGEFPCLANGARLAQLENENGERELFKGFRIKHRFSNKPVGTSGFDDHYTKVLHYITIISDQARVLEPLADARTGRLIEPTAEESVFLYADSASARYGTLAVTAKFAGLRIAIVGLGGTGSYVLDQVAKTPVAEIHLFDGGIFKPHTAFRAPGAATIEELRRRMPKVEYYANRYCHMHRGVSGHPYNLTSDNITELQAFDFVFVCVDTGAARKLITSFLMEARVPFVDVGMAVALDTETMMLSGICRATVGTPEASNHLASCLPVNGDDADHVYRTNIQIADLNAVNALLAVLLFKQRFGIYANDFHPHHLTFSLNSLCLTRDVLIEPT